MRTRCSKVLADTSNYEISEDGYKIFPDRSKYEVSEDSYDEADCSAGYVESYAESKELHPSKYLKRRIFVYIWDLTCMRYCVENRTRNKYEMA